MTLRALALAPLILATVVAPVLAADAEPDTGTSVRLLEQVERAIPRDRLSAVLRVEADGRDPAAVQAEVNRRMQAALDRAKGVPAVTIASGGYSVYRQPPASANDTAPDKWFASQSLTLTAKDFSPALKLIGELQGDGLLLDTLTFDVAPEALRATQDAMSDAALAALRARAEHVAAAMGMTVARYKSIDVGNVAQEIPRPMPFRMKAGAVSASSEPPPAVAESGDATATLTVNAEVILQAKK